MATPTTTERKYSHRVLRDARKHLNAFFEECAEVVKDAEGEIDESVKTRLGFYTGLYKKGLIKDQNEAVTKQLNNFHTLLETMGADNIHAFATGKGASADWIVRDGYTLYFCRKEGGPIDKTIVPISAIIEAADDGQDGDGQDELLYRLFEIFSCLHLDDELDMDVDTIVERYKPDDEDVAPRAQNNDAASTFHNILRTVQTVIGDPATTQLMSSTMATAMANPAIATGIERLSGTPIMQQAMGQAPAGTPGQELAPLPSPAQ